MINSKTAGTGVQILHNSSIWIIFGGVAHRGKFLEVFTLIILFKEQGNFSLSKLLTKSTSSNVFPKTKTNYLREKKPTIRKRDSEKDTKRK